MIAKTPSLLPAAPPCWPNDMKRIVMKYASRAPAMTATTTPVTTPTRTSFALNSIPQPFALTAAVSSRCT